jgi:extracellular factor (EF) 3-hydroxypalmitic acid methyl ester biosynthesis protein
MKRHFAYLRGIAIKGGPARSEYQDVDKCFQAVASAMRDGQLSSDYLDTIWPVLGEAFYSTRTMLGFANVKPHGYAGDFEIIDRIYQKWISPDAHLARWDHFFHDMQAPKAVRNRKAYFLGLVGETVQALPHAEVNVLNVGSGPARDVLEAFQNFGSGLTFDCIDHDPNAILYAKRLTGDFTDRIRFLQCNALRFRASSSYPLVWSAGLFDYLDDRVFKLLLKRLLSLVHEGGQLVIGNFSPENSSRDHMECGGWFLNHRTEEQLRFLAAGCGIPARHISVGREPEGVNLFLHIHKE